MEASNNKIRITEDLIDRLNRLLGPKSATERDHLRELRRRIEDATVVSPENMPPDVVTIGSRFQLKDLETGDLMTYTLVLPKRARIEQGFVSVLAPIGAQLLGAREGETITFSTPVSTRRLRIELVYAPSPSPMTAPI